MGSPQPEASRVGEFQCSSASRKFLNSSVRLPRRQSRRVSVLFSEPKIPQLIVRIPLRAPVIRFSALQRAENSSTTATESASAPPRVSVLFSEPKIPQHIGINPDVYPRRVSVLFSEPKIPQRRSVAAGDPNQFGFSALQRAENSSKKMIDAYTFKLVEFQCSSASRKFLN